MVNMILFAAVGLLLLILIAFLIIVIRDHLKSKSFELYIQEEENLLAQSQHHAGSTLSKREREPIKPPSKHEKEATTTPPSSSRSAKTHLFERTVEPLASRSFEQTPEDRQTSSEPMPHEEEKRSSTSEGPTLYQLHPDTTPESPEAEKEVKAVLSKEYAPFNHQRLVEGMGLSPQEADEFVVELIHQLESAINDLDQAIDAENYVSVEHITHGLKGAALNIGEGGVAQLLVDYNTYMKTHHERPVVEAYQTRLKQTVSDLKIEYSQVA